jgi:hypothetical protein
MAVPSGPDWRPGMIDQHPWPTCWGSKAWPCCGGSRVTTTVSSRRRGISEIRRLLDSPVLDRDGVPAPQVSTVDGYRVWSETYDQPGNRL